MLTDGTGATHSYLKKGDGSFSPPPGEGGMVAIDGTGKVSLTDESGTVYLFTSGGKIDQVVSPRDVKKPAAPLTKFRADTGLVDSISDRLSVVNAGTASESYDRSVQFIYTTDTPASVGMAAADLIGGRVCKTNPGTFVNDATIVTGPLLCRIVYPGHVAGAADMTEIEYDEHGNLIRITNPGGSQSTFAYQAGRVTQVRNSLINDWMTAKQRMPEPANGVLISYDDSGRATSVSLPAPDGVTDSARPIKRYIYDTAATVTSSGRTYIDIVDASGLVLPNTTVGSGHAQTVTFDSGFRVLTSTSASGLTSSTEWNSQDLALSSTDPRGVKSTSLYDGQNRVTDTYGPAPASCYTSDRVPSSSCMATTPHTRVNYDESLNGLDVALYNNIQFAGLPKAYSLGVGGAGGAIAKDWGTASPDPAIASAPWAARMTGVITFPAGGRYQFKTVADDHIRLYIDNRLIVDDPVVGPAHESPVGFIDVAAGQTLKIRLDYQNFAAQGSIDLRWAPPGSAFVTIPGTQLKPNYGLETSSTSDDAATVDLSPGQVSPQTTTTNYGSSPWLGLPVSTVVDPAGLALTSQTTYESSGLYNRVTGTLSPADIGTTTTTNGTSNSYWGANEATSSSICGVPSGTKQYGMLKTSRAAPATTETGLSAVTVTYVYDKLGRVAGTKSSGDTNYSCTTYDPRGRVATSTSKGLGLSTRTTTYGYSGTGNDPLTTWVKDDKTTGSPTGGKITTVTDLLGRVTSVTDVWATVTATDYNALSQPVTVTTTAGTTVYTLGYTYNVDGQVETVLDGGKVIADPAYTAGLLSSVDYPAVSTAAGNGTALQAISRDSAGRDTGLTWAFANDPLVVKDTVSRSQSGRIAKDVINDAHAAGTYQSNYTFDAAGRLTQAAIPGHDLSYKYTATNSCNYARAGANGNRTSMTDVPVGGGSLSYSQQYCYDKADRLLSEDETITGATSANAALTRPEKDLAPGTITYDAHGNVTRLGDQTFTYDASDRHMTTVIADGPTVAYVRDVTGAIVARTETSAGALPVTIRYSGSLILDGTGSIAQRNLSLPGGVSVSIPVTGPAVWAYPNIHGDITWTATSAGQRSGLYLYDPFGQPMDLTTKVIGSASSDQAVPNLQPGNYDQGWVGGKGRGYEHAGTIATIEMGVRMYAAWLGRFLAADPVINANTSRYNYPNDPVNMFDLDGKRPLGAGDTGCHGAECKGTPYYHASEPTPAPPAARGGGCNGPSWVCNGQGKESALDSHRPTFTPSQIDDNFRSSIRWTSGISASISLAVWAMPESWAVPWLAVSALVVSATLSVASTLMQCLHFGADESCFTSALLTGAGLASAGATQALGAAGKIGGKAAGMWSGEVQFSAIDLFSAVVG